MVAITIEQPRLIRKPFFSDRQLVRYLVQLLAVFSGYRVMTGTQRDGQRRLLDVPAMIGNMSLCSAYILGGGQDNVMVGLPAISLNMTSLKQKVEWRLNPQYTERFRYVERATDGDGNLLVNQKAKHTTIERAMPVPYDLDFEVTIWASNNDQGYQLLEQILAIFAPDQDIQLSNSPADWTFLTTLWYLGDVKFEEVGAGAGQNWDAAYTFTLSFRTVVAISLPAKVYNEKMIYKIEVPIRDLENCLDFDSMEVFDTVIIKATPEQIAEFGE